MARATASLASEGGLRSAVSLSNGTALRATASLAVETMRRPGTGLAGGQLVLGPRVDTTEWTADTTKLSADRL